MDKFCSLFERLDSTTSTKAKVEAMAEYFSLSDSGIDAGSAAWALFFLTGRRLLRFVPHGLLREWLQKEAQIPDWLFAESYSAVGDLAETIALLFPENDSSFEEIQKHSLKDWIEKRLLPLKNISVEEQEKAVVHFWKELPARQIFLLNKILTGAFRVGVSQTLVVRAIAQISEQTPSVISHRLMGQWEPTAEFFESLVSKSDEVFPEKDVSKPYPFFLASPIDREVTELGDPNEYQAEWKWDGIRAQLIRRNGETFIWSRGEDLISDRFPELLKAAETLPNGCVLDGEILAFEKDQVAPFSLLQTRIGRKSLSEKILKTAPVRMVCYDLIEYEHRDLREEPLFQRRKKLLDLLENRLGTFQISLSLEVDSWEQMAQLREKARQNHVEGLMLKKKSSPYGVGRKRGGWWKWKVDPYTIDAVLLYAQPGSGRRANLFTDYTFGIWRGDELVPIAKAYSGLSDQEILELDRWIRQNTKEKFGPVRSVDPIQTFEIAFEGLAPSPRHKSGFALRFPRIARWRKDKLAREADSTERVADLLRSIAA